MIELKIKAAVRDVKDFPKPGIIFKDITPLLKDPLLCKEIVQSLEAQLKGIDIDAIVAIESRGFLFGPSLAQLLNVPFIPIRKEGKLPYKVIQQYYDLEYGSAVLECHKDALLPNQKVLIHDDLLATGGTVIAASKLVTQLGASVAAYSFIVALDFLNGREQLKSYTNNIFALASY